MTQTEVTQALRVSAELELGKHQHHHHHHSHAQQEPEAPVASSDPAKDPEVKKAAQALEAAKEKANK